MSDLKKSLMTIAQEVVDLEKALIESGGLIDEEIEKRLAIKDLDLPVKVDNYAHILKRLDITSDHFRAQAHFFSQVARGIDSANDRLRENLKQAMEVLATNELKGQNFKLKMSRSKPAVIIENLDLIDGQFVVIETVKTPDKKAIAKHIESGGTVDGVRLEGQASLRIYPNKGE